MSQKKAGGGGWGSVFTGAIANLESRLDTILAEDPDASARERAATEQSSRGGSRPPADSNRLAAPSASGTASITASRDASRTRVNDRLAERLAKATAQKTPSRPSTPAKHVESSRPSGETKREGDAPTSVPATEVAIQDPVAEEGKANGELEGTLQEPGSLATSSLPINPARVSAESSRPSIEVTLADTSARTSLEVSNGTHSPGRDAELQSEMEKLQDEQKKAELQRQEEMHIYLERIDALQVKLTYLAKETVAAAKEANASAGSNLEKQVAEKDEKIALLMEEGEKLSKNDMQRLQTIKKLRTKATEDEKAAAELRKRVDRVEKAETDLKAKLRKSEASVRHASDKVKQIAVIEKQVDELKDDRERASELIHDLTVQLKEAKEKAEKAEKAEKDATIKAMEAGKGAVANLQNELEDAQLEKKLAEDRAAAEVKKAKEDAERQREKFGVRELELKNELHGMESKVEAMRARLEETSTTSGAGDGESAIKLMRQVETLQQQYALAKGNWETIEGSLNTRLVAMETERDEAAKRESDTRKKARDVGTKSRKVEGELESAQDRIKALDQELRSQLELIKSMQSRLEEADVAQQEAKAEFDRQRKLWETELSSRLEEEKLKWRREVVGPGGQLDRLQSPTASSRRAAAADMRAYAKPPSRLASHDLAAVQTDYFRQSNTSRRSSAIPTPTTVSARTLATPTDPSPSISRRESTLFFDPNSIPPTPSIEVEMRRLSEDDGDTSSPQRTLADLVSMSTAGPGGGAGPSVQLVERMSSLVRKLESEKASFKDELQRLSQQRDEARNEVVDLMREVETKRTADGKAETLEKDIGTLKKRYDASLEMLGEREEEVEELKDQIQELKRIYKELVETKVGRA